MTSRITRRFEELRRRGELGLIAFLTAGDPSLEATERFVLALAEAGADLVELGVPFSDPVADGPTIQRSSERALRAGTTLANVLELVRRLRRKTEIPLVIFSYFVAQSIIHLSGLATRNTIAVSIAIELLGMLLMCVRKSAVAQVIGFMSMESGIFFAAVVSTYGMPLIVELGVAFDILVASILFGVFFFHLRDSFGSLNVGQFNRLSEANQPMPLRDTAGEASPGDPS